MSKVILVALVKLNPYIVIFLGFCLIKLFLVIFLNLEQPVIQGTPASGYCWLL